MVIIRNSLAKGNEGLKTAIDASSYEKSKTFDKLVTSMIDNCQKSISEEEIDYVK